MTFKAYAEQWLAMRREVNEATRARYEATGKGKVQHRDHATDEGRRRKHVLPHLGAMILADVRLMHLAEWDCKLRTTATLAARTVRNVYGLVGAMFRDAAVAGHVENDPAILTACNSARTMAARKARGGTTRAQFALMIGSGELPDARVSAALGGLAGLRLGAIAGLRWGDLDTTAAPLWRLTGSRTYDGKPTKTGKPSRVPVHPVLAEMLAEWRHGGG